MTNIKDLREGHCWICETETEGFCRYDDGYGYQMRSICKDCYKKEIKEAEQ